MLLASKSGRFNHIDKVACNSYTEGLVKHINCQDKEKRLRPLLGLNLCYLGHMSKLCPAWWGGNKYGDRRKELS